jgi:branched-chain amino acid aminotransferase
MHRFLLHNDDICDAHDRNLAPGQVGLLNGWGVFSTLRVADGVLFAYERHWRRMQRDAARLRVPFPGSPEWLLERLVKLVDANQARNATLRVVVVRNRRGPFEGPDLDREFDVIAFTTDLADWGGTARLTIKPNGRFTQSEFSGAKILSWSHNLAWNEEARERGFDEVLLLNERGEVSECTSANILAAEGREVFTPPLSAGCLPGVTRELLLEAIHVPGIRVSERTLMPADLDRASQVFITSSTRDLLPVVSVEGLRIRNEGSVVDDLVRAFRAYRGEYIHASAVETKASV